ncbi:MAG: apolipoprotein N-acyltransferase, partial [Endomicrobia bacterium]|nr:apolipoprotein N-acyltransferase [Endomicrobiia bacterium]
MNKKYIYLINALLSGVFLFFSFPKFGSPIIGWVCFVPLFFSIFQIIDNKQQERKNIILLSFITGITGYCGVLYWIVPTFVAAGENWFYGVVALFLLSIYLTVYLVIFCYFLYILGVQYLNNVLVVISASSLWVLLEYIRGNVLSGFPWMLLGYSQYRNLYFIQISEYFGVYIISFFLILSNLL